MALVFQCSFMRAAILRNNEIYKVDQEARFERFRQQFAHTELQKNYFNRKSKELSCFVRKNSWFGKVRKDFLADFSNDTWNKLETEIKKEHTIKECKQCVKFFNTKNTFPKVICHRKKTPKRPLRNITNINKPSTVQIKLDIPIQKTKLPYMKVAAESILDSVNNEWDSIFDTPFTKVLSKIPSTNLTEKKTDAERKRNIRGIHRKIKRSIESTWSDNGKDFDAVFGTRQSKSSYIKTRSTLHFETP